MFRRTLKEHPRDPCSSASRQTPVEPRPKRRRVRYWGGRVRGCGAGFSARVPILLPEAPTPEHCLEACHLRRTPLELIAEHKAHRRQLNDDGNVEITGRDLREREAPPASRRIAYRRFAR